MNIVDVIKSQLGGEILGKLSSVIGESEDKTKTAVAAAVPGLLSVLAHVASSSSGADTVINALKQVDTGPSGGLGDILSGGHGPALEKGGSLLEILLGSSALPAILSVLSKFAGIASGPAKNLLSLLAPLILSAIAKQLTGKSLNSQTLSSFFAEQKPNITLPCPRDCRWRISPVSRPRQPHPGRSRPRLPPRALAFPTGCSPWWAWRSWLRWRGGSLATRPPMSSPWMKLRL